MELSPRYKKTKTKGKRHTWRGEAKFEGLLISACHARAPQAISSAPRSEEETAKKGGILTVSEASEFCTAVRKTRHQQQVRKRGALS